MQQEQNARPEYRKGLAAAAGTSALWGVLPIYWRAIDAVDSWLIILYRILLAGVFCFIFAMCRSGFEGIKAPLRQKGVAVRYFVSGILITLNWSTYIWAVNAGHVIEAGIGYYIEPLVVSLFGVLIFREKMGQAKKLAIALVFCAVMVMMIHFKRPPMISLTLAASFAAYAVVKKKYTMSPELSLLYETMFQMPVALCVILYLEWTGKGALSMTETPLQYVLLLLCGVVTAIPLLIFSYAASRIRFVTLGISQYISPTITLLLGIFFFQEAFDGVQLGAILLIWVGIVFFTVGEIREAGLQSGKKKEDLHETAGI